MVDIKFCGLMRPEDVAHAAHLGARYVGVIFAGGPRELTPDRAQQVFAEVPASLSRVGVFGGQSAEEIGRVAGRVGLDVVQLHGDTDAERVTAIRRVFGGHVWTVLRVTDHLPEAAAELADACDGLVLDTLVANALGGSGRSFDWAAVSRGLAGFRTAAPIVLAGGLRPENVQDAIASFAPPPDVVDVSSGVESAPGIKDPDRMRAFRDAVTQASVSR